MTIARVPTGYRLILGEKINQLVDVANGSTAAPVAATTLSVTGVATFANGLVGAPALTFTSDTDTGFYRTAANSLGVAAGGALVGTFTSTGLQGAVGATTPAAGAFTTLTASTGYNGVVGGVTPAAGTFTFVRGSVSAGVSAAGTTRSNATALTSSIVTLTTVGASTGVVLPASATVGIGGSVIVFNAGANAAQVYAAGSDTIDTVAGSTGVPLTNTKRAIFICVAANTFISAQLGVVSA